ncbi:hypothetical protein ACA910_005028 [Epithemia clementina (nom. ined.)]
MSKKSLATRIADVLHTTVVMGLVSYAGFQLFQIGRNVYEHEQIRSPYIETKYFDDVNAKIKEHEENDERLDSAKKYQDEDYIKKQLKASDYYQKK